MGRCRDQRPGHCARQAGPGAKIKIEVAEGLVDEEIKADSLGRRRAGEDVQPAAVSGSLVIPAPEGTPVGERQARAKELAGRAKPRFKHALVTFIETYTEVALAAESQLNLRLVVVGLHPCVPVEVRAERVIDAPRNQLRFGVRLRVAAHKQIVVVGVRAAIETHVRTVIARAPHRRILVAEMAAAHVVVSRINERILYAIKIAAFIRKEEWKARVRDER